MGGKRVTDIQEHFESKLILGHPGGHWALAASLNNKGYHTLWVGGGRSTLAHIVAYELYVGPIPDGLEIDHLCRVKWCCNPAHLEAVTRSENNRRAHPVCGAGLHDQTNPGERYIRPDGGGGMCKPCKLKREREYSARKRAARDET